MKKKTPRKSGAARLSSFFGFQPHTAGLPQIQLSSNRELVVEACAGIEKYSQEVIRLRTEVYSIVISGRGLTLKYLEQTIVQINGYIVSLNFDV